MIVDSHVHFIKPTDSHGRPQVYMPKPASAEDFVALMDKCGIDRAFYISWSPEDIPSDLAGKGIPVEAVRETMTRDYAMEVMRAYPGRFYWFPCHLGPGVQDHMVLARESLEMGAAGLKLVTSFWGELPDDPRPIAMCELAKEFDAQIILDTSFWYLGKDRPTAPDVLGEGHRDVARRVRDFQDYTGHLRNLFETCHGINVQLAHAGAREFTPDHAREVGELMREYPHVYADLGALQTDWPALELLVETAGEGHVMFGSDWPHFAQGSNMLELINHIRRAGRFPNTIADQILGQNALCFVKGREPGLREPSSG